MAWQAFLAARLGDMGDIEFLRQKSLNGDLVIVTNSVTAVGEITQYTPATGKTFFLYKAAIFFSNQAQTVQSHCKAEVRNDGTAVDSLGVSGYTANPYFHSGNRNESIVQADKLVGNSTKKYSIHCTNIGSASTTLYATLVGWKENT